MLASLRRSHLLIARKQGERRSCEMVGRRTSHARPGNRSRKEPASRARRRMLHMLWDREDRHRRAWSAACGPVRAERGRSVRYSFHESTRPRWPQPIFFHDTGRSSPWAAQPRPAPVAAERSRLMPACPGIVDRSSQGGSRHPRTRPDRPEASRPEPPRRGGGMFDPEFRGDILTPSSSTPRGAISESRIASSRFL